MKGGFIIKLSKSQFNQICSFLSTNLHDIKDFIEQNREDYEYWLQKQQTKITKIYTKFKVKETTDKSSMKIRKIYKSNDYHYAIRNCYSF